MKNPKRTTHDARRKTHIAILFTLIISCLLLPQAKALATTYYLDAVNGNDSYDGSSSNPWKTFTKALAEAFDGDTFYLRDGNYGSFINATERTNWVKFIAEPGQNAVNVDYIRMYLNANVYLWFEGLNIIGWDDDDRGIFSYGISHVKVIDCNFSSGPGCVGNNDSSGMAIKIQNGSDWHIENCDMNNWYSGVRGDDANDINIIGCDISLCVRGISASGNNWLIDDVDIHDATDGIRVHCANSVIEDCRIYDLYSIPDGPPDDHPDAIQGFRNGPYLDNIIIRRCIIGPQKYYEDSGQGIYFGMGTEECNHLTLESNVIYNTLASELYLLGAVKNTIIRNNIVDGYTYVSTSGGGAYIPSVTEMSGNISWRVSIDLIGGVIVSDHDYNIVNQWWGTWNGGPMKGWVPGPHEIEFQNQNTWEAQFADYDANDFHLAADSNAVDFIPLDIAPATDLEGKSRVDIPGVGNDGIDYADAGCYEYGTSTFLYGDVSGNGEISAYDAALTAQYAVGLIELTPDQITAADVSGNGEVSAYDAALIAQYSVGLIDKFPVE